MRVLQIYVINKELAKEILDDIRLMQLQAEVLGMNKYKIDIDQMEEVIKDFEENVTKAWYKESMEISIRGIKNSYTLEEVAESLLYIEEFPWETFGEKFSTVHLQQVKLLLACFLIKSRRLGISRQNSLITLSRNATILFYCHSGTPEKRFFAYTYAFFMSRDEESLPCR